MSDINGWVAFAILMENHDGILGKSPRYVHEKYDLCMSMEHPENLLDYTNKAKFDRYMERWFSDGD